MTSYLLISKNSLLSKEAAKRICIENNIHQLDQNVISKPSEAKGDTGRKTTKSIGIEDIKKIRQQIFLKPFKGKIKAIIIEDGESLTPEAQNALLKVLEEPPEHTFIIITAKNKDAILPTIQSRCAIIEYDEENTASDDETEKYITVLKNLSIKESLELAESLDRKKEQLSEKLSKIIIALHNQMVSVDTEEQKMLAGKVKALQVAHTIIATSNANARLTLETTFLTIANL